MPRPSPKISSGGLARPFQKNVAVVTEEGKGGLELFPMHASPEFYEPRFFPLDTPENCVECIALASHSAISGEISVEAARIAIAAAEKAAKILTTTQTANTYAASVLASFAVPDPASKNLGHVDVVEAEIAEITEASE